ncbi:MAG: hypothetical protein M3313_15720, partial [Actinomycetota bacterium]|nr:hypothetical protein [Actinomycetota bacterium]
VTSIDDQIDGKWAEIARLIGASDVLAQLKQEEETLTERLTDWQRNMHLAEAEQPDLDSHYGKLVPRHEQVMELLQQMRLDGSLVLGEDQRKRLVAEFAEIDPEPSFERFTSSVRLLRIRLAEQGSQARKDAVSAARRLRDKFERFQEQWPRPNLGVDPVESYEGFRAILDELVSSGLHERRVNFSRSVNEWSGQDLLRLHGAFQESIEEIESRLVPVNGILSKLPFGVGRDRLHITLTRREGKDIAQFRKNLRFLASDSTSVLSDDQVEARFLHLKTFIDRLRSSPTASERDHFIDVRRHVYIEAERRDVSGRQLGVYASLGGKSGGETQELVAFIVGAALRYQLGDADLARPRYAPCSSTRGSSSRTASSQAERCRRGEGSASN